MSIFNVILYPIETFLSFLLTSFHSIIPNYGIDIILLSLVVNIILLPIYMLAEKQQAKELAITHTMHNKLQEIKTTFQGQERFMMIQSLYNIHRYHPIMGLRTLGSLLIQIPFFFAAYHLLKNFDAIAGISFAFIPDLQKADALIPFGRYHINLLPLLMTIINIIAAQIYTRRKNPNALFSTWGMALLFLVLLYSSPAALVLYWTCNNIFTLIKNLVLEYRAKSHENSSPLPSTKTLFIQHISRRLGIGHAQDKIIIRTITMLWGLSAYFLLAYIFIPDNRTRGLVPHQLLNISVTLFACTALILLCTHWYRYRTLFSKIYLIGYVVFTTAGLSLLIYYVSLPSYRIDLSVIIIKLISFLLFSFPNLFFLPMLYRLLRASHTHAHTSLYSPPHTRIHMQRLYAYCLSVFVMSMLLFVVLPSQIYASAPPETGVTVYELLSYNLVVALIIMSSLIALFVLAWKISRYAMLAVGSVVTVLSALLTTFALIIPFDMGRLDHFKLIFPQRIVPTTTLYVIEGIGVILLAFYVIQCFIKKPQYITTLASLISVFLLFSFIRTGVWKSQDLIPQTIPATEITHTEEVPASAHSLFSFSRTKQNIVVVLLDMANGGYVQRILQEDGNFAHKYQGFTWYPNTLSISTFTTSSKPSMLAGWRYTPRSIGSVKGANLAQKVGAAYNTLFDTFQSHQYDIAITGVSYYGADVAQCSVLEAKDIACLDYWDTSYEGFWLNNNLEKEEEQDSINAQARTTIPRSARIMLVNMAGLLRSVPLFLKQRVYDKGNWNLFISIFKNQEGYNFALKEWALLDSMPLISRVRLPQEDTRNTFKFIHSNITHRPYALSPTCRLENDTFPDEKAGNDFEGDAAYFAQRCSLESLSKWIEWLKKHEIYDNTKIILVSDHGNDFAEDPMNTQQFSPSLMMEGNPLIFNRIHPLLLVKDFNAHGDMKRDNRFMSNADTASIMFHSIKHYTPPEGAPFFDTIDPTKTLLPSRTLPVFHTQFYNWVDLVKEPKEFKILQQHEVKDNLFDPQQWN